MWQCQHCGENIDEEFALCWNCGATANGEPDPSFLPVDMIEREAKARRNPIMTAAQRRTWIFLWAVIVTLLMLIVNPGVVYGRASLLRFLFYFVSCGLTAGVVLLIVWVAMGAYEHSGGPDETSS